MSNLWGELSMKNRLSMGMIVLLLARVLSMQALDIAQADNNCIGATSPAFDWAIVGAGPAGIVTVGLLLDLGVDPQRIAWFDDKFNVGRLGEFYSSVPANTPTSLFIDFIQHCKTFNEFPSAARDALFSYDRDREYPLATIIAPLQDITRYMCSKVVAIRQQICALDFNTHGWNVYAGGKKYIATHVVLATGAHPRSFNYPVEHEIPLDVALNKEALSTRVNKDDSVAVIGSAHSAVLVMKFLSELQVTRIINFYNKPLQYKVEKQDVLYKNIGLLGIAAQWAQTVLEKSPPGNLVRVYNSFEARQAWLPICNKIVYAVGYDRNDLPLVNGVAQVSYDPTSGVIAPGLFGIGIAFPEVITDAQGVAIDFRIGLNSFMDYAQRVIPHWLQRCDRSYLGKFEALFSINVL